MRLLWVYFCSHPALCFVRIAALLLSALTSIEVHAEFIHPDLTVGSQYQLVFVTNGKRNGGSSNINSYNNFVRAQADLNPNLPDVMWNAIASTGSVDARENAPSIAGVPVYNTNGQLVTAAGLYTTTLSAALDNRVTYDQFGDILPSQSVDAYAWTGSNPDGTAAFGAELGNQVSQRAKVGDPFDSNRGWLSNTSVAIPISLRMYALSNVLTMGPRPVPGDFNNDGFTDAADYVIWRKGLGTAVPACTNGDANCNGFVELLDYGAWRDNYGHTQASSSGSGASMAIPEPKTSSSLMGLVLISVCLRVAVPRYSK